MNKNCNICDLSKPIDLFYLAKTGKFGRRNSCKQCESIKEKNKRANRSSDKKKKDQQRDSVRKRFSKYGLSPQDFEKLLVSQNYKCAICCHPIPDLQKKKGASTNDWAAVDHDHSTGRIRGLLCFWCNKGLGHFKDDCDLLLKALEYLSIHSKLIVPPHKREI